MGTHTQFKVSIMYLAVFILAATAGSLEATSSKCCFYPKFSTRMLVTAATKTGNMDANIDSQTILYDYDFNKGKTRAMVTGSSLTNPGAMYMVTEFNDFHNKMRYSVTNGTCTPSPLTESQNSPCVPDGFTSDLDVSVGVASQMHLNFWSGMLNGAMVTYSVTDDCTPVTMQVNGQDNATSFLSNYLFTDVKADMLSSDDALDMPMECS